ncbi:MAG: hypothetical protein EZS28_002822 [Streblomastix strix]|uniref:Uncharacterized protein n=1 Tax=Streblomastix strix TaxID=222440 RepID=A0A5J4X345_9EUKA|nr:MAG: hypothetical protein EZS28_002822 [Streblomastix strix]
MTVMFRDIHNVLSTCWLGRRPGAQTKIHKALCYTSLHFIVMCALQLYVNSIVSFQNYRQHLRFDFITAYCQLIKYQNYTLPFPYSDSSRGLCVHQFQDYSADIIELSKGHCTLYSRDYTNWPAEDALNNTSQINVSTYKTTGDKRYTTLNNTDALHSICLVLHNIVYMDGCEHPQKDVQLLCCVWR